MRHRLWILVLVAGIAACKSSDGTPVPAEVRALQAFFEEQAIGAFGGIRQFLAAFGQIVEGGGEGITFEPNPAPGAPANSYIFEIPLDTDGNGSPDSTLEGTVLLSADPTPPILVGFSATADFDLFINNTIGSGRISGVLVANSTLGGLIVWGSGEFVDYETDTEGTFAIDETDPVTVRQSTVEGEGNVCEADVQGPIEISAGPAAPAPVIDVLPAGHMKAIFEFFFGDRTIQVHDTVYNDPTAGEVDVPDSTIELPPCGASIDDWVGSFILEWNCDGGSETGTSRVQFTKINETTLRGRDSDPNNPNDFFEFDATADPNNPHRITGFFIDTDSGGTYREDFVMTLAPDGNSWTQDNTYQYQDGMMFSGTCGGTGTREE